MESKAAQIRTALLAVRNRSSPMLLRPSPWQWPTARKRADCAFHPGEAKEKEVTTPEKLILLFLLLLCCLEEEEGVEEEEEEEEEGEDEEEVEEEEDKEGEKKEEKEGVEEEEEGWKGTVSPGVLAPSCSSRAPVKLVAQV